MTPTIFPLFSRFLNRHVTGLKKYSLQGGALRPRLRRRSGLLRHQKSDCPRLRHQRFHRLWRSHTVPPKSRRFKPPQPLSFSAHANTDSLDYTNIAPQDASVIFFGDSFGFCDWGGGDFQTQLSAATDKKIYSIYNNHHPDLAARPPQFLQSIPVPTSKRIFVYERVERNLDGSFGTGFAHMMDTFHKAKTGRIKWLYNCWFENTEARHELLLKDNTVTFPLTEAWNSAAFEYPPTNRPPTLPGSSSTRPFLFYKEMKVKLASRPARRRVYKSSGRQSRRIRPQPPAKIFNCTLVFVPVPNKISVYSQLAHHHPSHLR